MGRGFWLPPGAENLLLFDGFYVDSKAVYTGEDIATDWQIFLEKVCKKMFEEYGDPLLTNYNKL